MSATQVKALQHDTLDAIAYRYYGNNSLAMLSVLLDANPKLTAVILDQHQLVNVPVLVSANATPTLKLWD